MWLCCACMHCSCLHIPPVAYRGTPILCAVLLHPDSSAWEKPPLRCHKRGGWQHPPASERGRAAAYLTTAMPASETRNSCPTWWHLAIMAAKVPCMGPCTRWSARRKADTAWGTQHADVASALKCCHDTSVISKQQHLGALRPWPRGAPHTVPAEPSGSCVRPSCGLLGMAGLRRCSSSARLSRQQAQRRRHEPVHPACWEQHRQGPLGEAAQHHRIPHPGRARCQRVRNAPVCISSPTGWPCICFGKRVCGGSLMSHARPPMHTRYLSPSQMVFIAMWMRCICCTVWGPVTVILHAACLCQGWQVHM